MVARRGAYWSADQVDPTLGQAGYAPISAQRPTPCLGMDLWRHLPGRRQGSRTDHAPLQQRGHEPAPRGNLSQRRARRACRHHPRPGGMAWIGNAGRAGQHHPLAAAAPLPRAQSRREPVAVHARNWLSNRIFKSYDDIVDHCCFAWNKLVDQPWRIMSIGLRTWAHGC